MAADYQDRFDNAKPTYTKVNEKQLSLIHI